MSLYSYFLNNTGRGVIKYTHYFHIYERYFARYVNTPVTLFEIGTGSGGSARMWQHYFVPLARIVTIDIRPDCKAFEEEQIFARIGHQGDLAFLATLVEEFGSPDIVVDDGSHQMADINATFDFLYPRTAQNGIYLVEDLQAAYWPNCGGGLHAPSSFIERCKGFIDELHARYIGLAGDVPLAPETPFSRSTAAIHIYDSVVVFERAPYMNKTMLDLPTNRGGSA